MLCLLELWEQCTEIGSGRGPDLMDLSLDCFVQPEDCKNIFRRHASRGTWWPGKRGRGEAHEPPAYEQHESNVIPDEWFHGFTLRAPGLKRYSHEVRSLLPHHLHSNLSRIRSWGRQRGRLLEPPAWFYGILEPLT